MCLIINRGTKVQVAKHDITVYKLICKEGSVLSPYYVTPYMNMEINVETGSIISPKNSYCYNKEHFNKLIKNGQLYLNEGLIHAYLNKENCTITSNVRCYRLLKCIIPKGEFYIIGNIGDVAASKLIVKEICA